MSEPLESAPPRVPNSLDEVRFAAGFTPPILDTATHKALPPFRVLFELDAEAGVWVASCLEHYVYLESAPGANLGEINAMFRDRLVSMMCDGSLARFDPAAEEVIRRWDDIRLVGKPVSFFGKAEEVLEAIAPPSLGEVLPFAAEPKYVAAANLDLAMAA